MITISKVALYTCGNGSSEEKTIKVYFTTSSGDIVTRVLTGKITKNFFPKFLNLKDESKWVGMREIDVETLMEQNPDLFQ